MWLTTCPDKFATLRQGDFLYGLVLPRLRWPLSYARPPEGAIAKDQPVLLTATKPYGYLVVSQCCTIENQVVAALAEVKSTKPLSDQELSDYEREEPEIEANTETDEEGQNNPRPGYVFNAHPLAPFDQYLGRAGGRIYIADLTTIQTYSGTIKDFQEARVAAMDPIGRRALRIRLALFWGRVEAEDEQWLTERGIPVGERPPAPAEEVQAGEQGETAQANNEEKPPEGASSLPTATSTAVSPDENRSTGDSASSGSPQPE
jgi:hypothetical protein